VAIEFVVLAAYGGLAGRVSPAASRPRFARLVDGFRPALLAAGWHGAAAAGLEEIVPGVFPRIPDLW